MVGIRQVSEAWQEEMMRLEMKSKSAEMLNLRDFGGGTQPFICLAASLVIRFLGLCQYWNITSTSTLVVEMKSSGG